MNQKLHLYVWQPGEDDEDGEMKHFEFSTKESLVEYLNQMAREMETMPIMTHEFGLKKSNLLKIGDFVYNGNMFINYGTDLDVKLSADGTRVEDVYPAE